MKQTNTIIDDGKDNKTTPVRKERNTKPPKKWTWSKPKDKPKRPLSAYNIFFCYTRSRIIEGLPLEGECNEVIAAIEHILATSTKKTKKRIRTKSHGKVEFGDLGKRVAEMWKNTKGDRKAVFQHYADIDRKRYFAEVAIWKKSKEAGLVLDLKTTAKTILNGDSPKCLFHDNPRSLESITQTFVSDNALGGSFESSGTDIRYFAEKNQRLRQEINRLAAALTEYNSEGNLRNMNGNDVTIKQQSETLMKQETTMNNYSHGTLSIGQILYDADHHRRLKIESMSAANALLMSNHNGGEHKSPFNESSSNSSEEVNGDDEDLKSFYDSLDPVPLVEIHDCSKYYL